MSELVEFLRQRLDEDEHAARAAMTALGAEDGMPSWPDYQTYDTPDIDTAQDYLTRFQPARVLADVKTKRAIIAECPASGATGNDLTEALGGLVLTHLAQPYAGHPEFREEWRV